MAWYMYYMLRKRTWRYHAPPHPTPPHPRAMCRRVSSVVSVAVHVDSKCTWTSHSVAWYMLRKRRWRYHAPPHPAPPHPRAMCRRVSSVVSVAVHVDSKCTWTSHSVAWYMLRKRRWRYHAPPHPTPPHPRAMCRRVSSVVSVAVHVDSKCTWTSHSVAWYILRKRRWRYHAPPHPTPPHPRAMCPTPDKKQKERGICAKKREKSRN